MEEKIMGILMQILEDVSDLKKDTKDLKEDNKRHKTGHKRIKRRPTNYKKQYGKNFRKTK